MLNRFQPKPAQPKTPTEQTKPVQPKVEKVKPTVTTTSKSQNNDPPKVVSTDTTKIKLKHKLLIQLKQQLLKNKIKFKHLLKMLQQRNLKATIKL